MMNNTNVKFSKAVNTLLKEISQGVKVFSVIAKDNVDKYNKFIVFKRQGLIPQTSKDRITHRQTTTYDVNIFAKDYNELLDIAQIIIDETENKSFDNVEGYEINNVILNDINEEFSDEYGLYAFTMSFDFVYTVNK